VRLSIKHYGFAAQAGSQGRSQILSEGWLGGGCLPFTRLWLLVVHFRVLQADLRALTIINCFNLCIDRKR